MLNWFKSKPRVTIHLGVQKTASKSMQYFIRQNSDVLADQMLFLSPEKGSPALHLGRTAAKFSLDPNDENRIAFIDRIRAIRDIIQRSSCDTLLSHENLPGAVIGRAGVTMLYPRLENILTLLETHLDPIKPHFVVMTRDMPAWKRSVYNEVVKSDGYAETFETFLTDTAHCGTWADLEKRMVNALGRDRVTFRRLEDEKTPGYPASQILRAMGWADEEIALLTPHHKRRNQSMPNGALEFLRQLNGLGLHHGPRNRVAQIVRDNPALFVAYSAETDPPKQEP